MDRVELQKKFGELLNIVEKLRKECPWDSEQTPQSIRPLTIEESYELSEAILDGSGQEMAKELGDLLLHIILYSIMGEERGEFNFESVVTQLSNKLVFRHPHIFAGEKIEESEGVVKRWEELKQIEKGGNRSLFAGVPSALPTLIKAFRLQEKAAAVGFDWEDPNDVWDKVKEEIGEFERELLESGREASSKERGGREEEFGDLLFSLINVARLYGIDPDTALEKSNRKFIGRINYIERGAKERGGRLIDLDLPQMESLWQEAKGEDWRARSELLIGKEGINRLENSSVAVVGLGGVGGSAAEMLARAGVGSMVIVDPDIVLPTNKNRQLLALESTLFKSKALVMERRLKEINPKIEVVRIEHFLDGDNLEKLLSKEHIDFIVDAIDTVSPKVSLIKFALANSIPLVSSMGAGAKFDTTKVRIADISKSFNCPLAGVIRKRLRKEGIKGGFKVVFSEELPQNRAIVAVEEQNKKSMTGTISYLPTLFGCCLTQVVIEELLSEI
ncbi:MAG: nucleoside triphosphate pyrophosphohydrolase [Bacteroidales bacterium]